MFVMFKIQNRKVYISIPFEPSLKFQILYEKNTSLKSTAINCTIDGAMHLIVLHMLYIIYIDTSVLLLRSRETDGRG